MQLCIIVLLSFYGSNFEPGKSGDNTMQNSAKYEAVIQETNIVFSSYRKAAQDYRDGKIDDAEFSVYQKEYKAAQSRFDAAYEAEQS